MEPPETTLTDDPEAVSLQYPVSIWEGIGIMAGAVVLGLIGLLGLGSKAISNSTDPERAEAIANSIMHYTLPGASQGVFGLNIGSIKMAVISSRPPATPVDLSQANAPTQVELLIARTPLTSRARFTPTDGDSDFSLVSVPGFSISYDIQGEFEAHATRDESRELCEAPTVVTVQEGVTLLPEASRPVPAVRYEATAVLDDQRHQVILVAIGQEAQTVAADVFTSLRCR